MHKLIVIDDDQATRILITEILEGANIAIIQCEWGNEALLLYKQYLHEIVLVLLDIKLPDCKGWDLCKRLRSIYNSIPIIAISAIIPSELKYNYKEAGFNGWMEKPFDIDELERMVKSYL